MRAKGNSASGDPTRATSASAGRMQTNMKEQLAWLESVRVPVSLSYVLLYCADCELTRRSNCGGIETQERAATVSELARDQRVLGKQIGAEGGVSSSVRGALVLVHVAVCGVCCAARPTITVLLALQLCVRMCC